MKVLKLAAVLAAAAALAGCGMIRDKASGYYLSKARETVAAQNPSYAALEKAYSDIGRSLDYRPSSRALEILAELTEKSNKAGFPRGADLELDLLKRVLRASPADWPVYATVVNALSARGDLFSLYAMSSRLESLNSSKDNPHPYETAMALALCYASMVPWVESQGYLSLNNDPGILIEKVREYSRVRRRAEELQTSIIRMDSVNPALRSKVPQALLSSADVALGDLAASRLEAERVYSLLAKLDSDPAFLRAVGLTVQGNSALVQKDYSGARAFYQSAMRNYPGFIDARKQLVEVDFQEGAGLALTEDGVKAGKSFLYRAYDESDAVIEAALQHPGWMPFMTRDKFLSDTYAIRAAVISAVNAIEKGKLKNKAKLKKEFKNSLDEAIRLNPQGKLARDLLERYTKDGF